MAKNIKPKKFDRNLIVIGAGAGGLVSAYIASAVKAKVTLIEAKNMGGDCLNFGCVPSKALINASKLAQKMRDADKFGINAVEPKFKLADISKYVNNSIKSIEPHDSVERYTNLGVEVLLGYAKLIDRYTVEINLHNGETKTLTARNIILATGASPFIPEIDGLKSSNYVTSDTLWNKLSELEELPNRILVIGGGAIGCELSQCFARLNAKVTLVERNKTIMSAEDGDISAVLAQSLQNSGINILTEHDLVKIIKEGDQQIAILKFDDTEIKIEFDMILLAIGRKARLTGYGLEDLDIKHSNVIETDEYLATTTYPNIFAVGDAAGPYQFTHVAAHQAWYAAVNALFGNLKKFKADYRVIPKVTFTSPEVASVGLNEREAKLKNIAYDVTIFKLKELDKAIIAKATDGHIKVLTEPNKDKILGVSIVGDEASNLIQEFVFAMKYNMGLNKILSTIHPYLTWTEANKYVSGEWKRSKTKQIILDLLEKYHRWRIS